MGTPPDGVGRGSLGGMGGGAELLEGGRVLRKGLV